MRIPRRIALYLLVVATLCMGCGGRVHMRQLQELEAQLDSVPHLVRQGLDSIPFVTLRGEARALYAILRTQADYKCYVPLTTDTLIRYATDYYNTNRKNYRAAMAWYSLGCVYTELGDDANAIYAYLRAKTCFPDTTIKYHAFCNQNIGIHYLHRGMFDEALSALQSFDRIATVKNYDLEMRAASRLEIARIYMHRGLPEHARRELEQLLQDSLCNGTIAQILFELGKIEHVFYENYDIAEQFFDQSIILDNNIQASDYYFKAEIEAKRGDVNKSIAYYQEALKRDEDIYLRYNCIRNLMYLLVDSMHYPQQHTYIRLFENLNDSIVQIQQQAEILEIENSHIVELKEREFKEQKRQFAVWGVTILIMVVCSTIVVWLLVERKRKAYIRHLQDTLLRNQAELHKLRITPAVDCNNVELREIHIDTAGMESNDSSKPDSQLNRSAILMIYKNNIDTSVALFKRNNWATLLNKKEIVEEKDTMFSLSERDQLRNVLFNCFSTVVSNLYDEASNLNDKEVLHCLLSSLNYSSHIIKGCLMASSLDVVRMQKYRIKKKLPEDVFLLFFSKNI